MMLDIYLCKNDETVEEALAKVNETDRYNRTFEVNTSLDKCNIGDAKFVAAPVLINCKNSYYALHEIIK